jgi:hypothetical protein
MEDYPKRPGIESSEIERCKAAGECLTCAWPSDTKGNNSVKDCIRPTKLDKGTANYPKAKEYKKMKVARLELNEEEGEDLTSEDSESERSDSGDSEEASEEESDGEYLDESQQEEQQEQQEEGNWLDSPPDSEFD